MRTYIDKNSAIDALCKDGCARERAGQLILSVHEAKQLFVDIVENTPAADVVEIIYCKDCVHRPVKTDDWYDVAPPSDYDEVCPCLCTDPFYNWMPDDYFYCARAERGNNG